MSLQNNSNRPYGAHLQDKAPEFFPLRGNIFFANVKSSFFPETELKGRVFSNRPSPYKLGPYKKKPVAQRRQMVSGSLALLFIGLELPLGSRAAAPIGDEVL